MKFVSFSVVGKILFGSDSGPSTAPGLIVSLVGEKKERKEKKSLLLTLNQPSKLCWSSWLQQGDGGWVLLFFLPMVLRGMWPGLWGQVSISIFTVAQPPAQFLSSLPGLQCPSVPGLYLQSTRCAVLVVHQLQATHTPPSRSL